MLRLATVAGVLCAYSVIAAGADGEPTPEQRKMVVDAILAKKNRGITDTQARIDAVAQAKINPKLKADVIPARPGDPHTFRSQATLDAFAKKTAAELPKQVEAAKKVVVKLEDFENWSLEKNAFGWFSNPLNLNFVDQVLDKDTAVIEVRRFNPRGGPHIKSYMVVGGIDTSSMADGKQVALDGFYFCIGNAKVGGRTLMKIVPFTLTAEERAQIGEVELKAEKKPK